MDYEYWQTPDYGSRGRKVNLSRISLGLFFHSLYTCGGEVISQYIMRKDFQKCYCQFTIKLPKDKKQEFESYSGLVLEPIASFSPA